MKTDRATHLFNKIKSLPDRKRVLIKSKHRSYRFLVLPDGSVDNQEEGQLRRAIKSTLSSYGSIIIRQLTNKVFKKERDGYVDHYVYEYCILLENGKHQYMTAQELEELHDSKSKYVVCKSFKNEKSGIRLM